MIRLAVPALLVVTACAPPATVPSPATAPPQRTFAIADVRVFDGERMHPRATVVVRDGRVAAIGDAPPPAGLPIVRGDGRTLLAGLIDAHVHAFADDALEQAISFGVTTVLDMFTSTDFAAARRAERGRDGATPLAELFSAGTLATAPGGHGTQYGLPIPTLTAPEQADAWVAARAAEGSDFIKIVLEDGSAYGRTIPTLDVRTLRALVEAARARGLKTVTHVATLASARDAIEAGTDGLAHLFVDRAIDADLVRLARERGVFVIPTTTVLESATLGRSGDTLMSIPALAAYVPLATEAGLRAGFPVRAGGPERFGRVLSTIGALHDGGVPILAGSDAPNPGTGHGVSLHRELELLVRAGLTPVAALRSATAATADAFGLADRGRIAPGMRADLVLVRGNPGTDIRATREIVHVWKGGIPIDRAAAAARVALERSSRDRLAAAAAADPALVSDFADGYPGATFGAGWMVSTDAFAGGRSTATMEAVPEGWLRVRGTLVPSAMAWAGVMFAPGRQPMQPTDLSAHGGIAFRVRGDGRTYALQVFAASRGMIPATSTFVVGTEWTDVVVRFADLGIAGSDVSGVVWSAAATGGDFTFDLDRVWLVDR